ncbi:MAG TPA: aconitase X catalytic domain-containing protein [Thermoplasmata archaeon]|nr:aconitase X catalytic domain-containing protein [Thermoplasmata archaeon]
MHLTREEDALAKEGTPAEQLSMRILTTLGDVYGADRLIPIKSAHVSGVSLKTLGEPGLEFLEGFAATAKVRVRTTVNPMGLDPERAKELGIPPETIAAQQRIADAYRQIGAEPTFSCTPYLVGNRPNRGEHVAWAESSAVVFANAVLGARTNREGGPSALAAAVTGRTPDYGLHRDEHRKATHVVDVRAKIHGYRWSLLGLHVGALVGDGVPYFRGVTANESDLKWLGAALASSGSVGMFHMESVTPEWREAEPDGLPTISVSEADLTATRDRYTTGSEPDAIGLGSPQLSADEVRAVADLLEKHRPRPRVYVFTSRAAKGEAAEAVKRIEALGHLVLADTCLEVSPMDLWAKTTATPSGKGAVYLPTLCGQKVVLEDLEELLRRFA